MIQKSFIGRYVELTNKIADLEHKLIMKDKDIELINEKHNNEVNEEKHKNELKDKDIELLQMKLIITEMKINK